MIRAGLLQSTLILLPVEEKVATVFGGDTVDWVFDGGHVASRFISIKPKVANSSTDIHIVSDHGNEYTLQLREISSEADPHFDSKVFIAPGDKAAKDRLAELPVFVPAAELDKVKQEAAAAKAAQAAELKGGGDQGRDSIAASIPAASTSTTPGTRRRQRSLGCSRYGAMTSSRICAASFRRPRPSTR